MPKFNWFTRKPKPTKQERIREELRQWNEEGLGDTSEYDTVPSVPKATHTHVGAVGDVDVIKFVRDTVPYQIDKLTRENDRLAKVIAKNVELMRKLEALHDAINKL